MRFFVGPTKTLTVLMITGADQNLIRPGLRASPRKVRKTCNRRGTTRRALNTGVAVNASQVEQDVGTSLGFFLSSDHGYAYSRISTTSVAPERTDHCAGIDGPGSRAISAPLLASTRHCRRPRADPFESASCLGGSQNRPNYCRKIR